ncbi:MAG: hypothetical protein Ct9H300mP15_13000 [Gemmatimonadota bacterium]|jgi:hypothetical protein|nr:MAG: hypothetical protein Ct9H300mP15_13000 [Gemmatimonadota bacterium]
MRPYRLRAALLLFLVLNLTACQTWQSISLDNTSPVQLIEEDRVRVTGGDVLEQEVVAPSVEGDQLVGAGDFSMPLADITEIEFRRISVGRTILLVPLAWLSIIPILIVACVAGAGDC